MPQAGKLLFLALIAATACILAILSYSYQGDRKAFLEALKGACDSLGPSAIPVFVLAHTVAISVCFPYAIVFEAGASFLFGFVRGVACIFTAKVLGASLAFFLGRALFRSFQGLSNYVRKNRYFNVISEGVARDGWKFVLLARFSPVPSYIINYGLAATDINFLIDFLLPTICGGLPMIIQNASIGSLTSAATQAGGGSSDAGVLSYLLPATGVSSSLLITWRIKKYASQGFKPEVQQENGTIAAPQQDRVLTSPLQSSAREKGLHQRSTASSVTGGD